MAAQHPVAGKIAIYSGMFVPHWEISHIRVRVSRTRRVLFASTALIALGMIWYVEGVRTLDTVVFASFIMLVGAIPSYECWAARFPQGFSQRPLDEIPEEELFGQVRYLVVFEGIVSERGRFGHMGSMHRQVEILRVLQWVRANSGFLV